VAGRGGEEAFADRQKVTANLQTSNATPRPGQWGIDEPKRKREKTQNTKHNIPRPEEEVLRH